MKSIIKYWYLVCIISTAMACNELDNYDAPSKKLTGRIVYNGQPINVERNQVRIQLWESGWELKTPISHCPGWNFLRAVVQRGL